MTPMLFDLIIVALILLSIGLGFVRGFVNEVFTIFGWVAAIIATIYFQPVLKEYGQQLIEKEWLANLATAAFIFLLTLGIFSAISYYATRTLHASKLGIVDRSLGFGFGILRAVVLLGLGYLLFAYVFSRDESKPEFIMEARTRPFLEASAEWLQAILPIEAALDLEDKDDPVDRVMKPEDDSPLETVEPVKDEESTLEPSTEKRKSFIFRETPAETESDE